MVGVQASSLMAFVRRHQLRKSVSSTTGQTRTYYAPLKTQPDFTSQPSMQQSLVTLHNPLDLFFFFPLTVVIFENTV